MAGELACGIHWLTERTPASSVNGWKAEYGIIFPVDLAFGLQYPGCEFFRVLLHTRAGAFKAVALAAVRLNGAHVINELFK
jgi:hypothetical protein